MAKHRTAIKVEDSSVSPVSSVDQSATQDRPQNLTLPAKGGKSALIEIRLSDDQQAQYDSLLTKSARIRYLASLDFSVGQISKFMGIIYQHARNVLKSPMKRPAA